MKSEDNPQPFAGGEPKTCPECQGRGWKDNRCQKSDEAVICSHCNGRGFDSQGKECYGCHGTGLIEVRTVDKIACELCRGAGVYPVPPSMTIEKFAYRPGMKR